MGDAATAVLLGVSPIAAPDSLMLGSTNTRSKYKDYEVSDPSGLDSLTELCSRAISTLVDHWHLCGRNSHGINPK
jgi:hypothetical protein